MTKDWVRYFLYEVDGDYNSIDLIPENHLTRIKYVLPFAMERYIKDFYSHDSSLTHDEKISMALDALVFISFPMLYKFERLLIDELIKHYKPRWTSTDD